MEILQDFFDQITDYVASIPNVVPILVTLIIGIALVGWGYSLFRVWMTVLGLIAGYRLGTMFAEFLELEGWAYAVVVILITLGITLFFWLAVKLSIFFAGFFFGMYLVRYFGITLFALDSEIAPIVGGLVLGLVAVFLLRFFIIGVTAISGSYLVSDAIFSLIQNTNAGTWLDNVAPARNIIPITMQILLIAVAALGFIYQYRRSTGGSNIKLHGEHVR